MTFLYRTFLLLTFLWTSACGQMPAQYDEPRLACGEMDSSERALADGLVQVVDGPRIFDGHELMAQWMNKAGTTPLAVSRKGCILLPPGDGTLKVITRDRRQGLILKKGNGTDGGFQQLTLKSLVQPRLQISCDKLLTKSLKEFVPRLQWQDMKPDDAWQIEAMHVHLEQQGYSTPQRHAVPVPDGGLLSELPLTALSLTDGLYTMRLELTTIAGVRLTSESSCNFQLDTEAPKPSKALAHTVTEGHVPLRLMVDASSTLFFCIRSSEMDGCRNPDEFQRAGDYVNAPPSGPYILHSFREDAAGNRSSVIEEVFYRDATHPTVNIAWLQDALQSGDGWSVGPAQTYHVRITAQDDAIDAAFSKPEELHATVECRVRLIDPAGAERAGGEAECSEGSCQGQSLGSWVPCAGQFSFHFKRGTESSLLKSQVVLEVRARDLAGHEGRAQTAFWMNPDAMGQWIIDETFKLPDHNLELRFARDSKGRLLAFTPSLDIAAGNPAVYFKGPYENAWSGPTPVAETGLVAFPCQPLVLTRSLDPRRQSDSLWLVARDHGLALAELPLDHIAEVLVPVLHPLPQDLQKEIESSKHTIVSAMGFHDGTMKNQLAVLFSDFKHQDFLLLAFDGSQFRVLARADSTRKDEVVGSVMTRDPAGRIIFLLNGRLAVWDPQLNRLSFPEMRTSSPEGLRTLQRDEQGMMFGLTQADQLFTLSFDETGQVASVNVLEESEALAGLNSKEDGLLRRADGSFWLWGTSLDSPLLYGFRPGLDETWQLQNSLWGWPWHTALPASGFGIDTDLDQLFALTGASRQEGNSQPQFALRKTMNCDFVDVTQQGAFRSDIRENSLKAMQLAQDREGRIWRSLRFSNGQLALAPLGEARKVLNVPTKQLEPTIDHPELILDQKNSIWLTSVTGEVFAYNPEREELTLGFKLPNGPLSDSFFDANGHYWGLIAHPVRAIGKRSLDDSFKTLPVPGRVRKLARWDQDRAWFIAVEGEGEIERETLYELDLRSETYTKAVQLPHSDLRFKDIIRFGTKLLAVVGVPDELIEPRPSPVARWRQHLQLFEFNGTKWIPWLDQAGLQLRLPSWHPNAGSFITSSRMSEARLFFDPTRNELWLSAEVTQGAALVARFMDRKWKVFHPHLQNIDGFVKTFLKDPQGRLLLGTVNGASYYNPYCLAEPTASSKLQ